VSGQSLSLIGTWVETVAQGLLVLRLTHSAVVLGLATAARYGPILVLSPYAGLLVDRVSKRRVLLVTQAGLGVVSLLLGLAVLSGTVRLHPGRPGHDPFPHHRQRNGPAGLGPPLPGPRDGPVVDGPGRQHADRFADRRRALGCLQPQGRGRYRGGWVRRGRRHRPMGNVSVSGSWWPGHATCHPAWAA
jgi:hypothetical protein